MKCVNFGYILIETDYFGKIYESKKTSTIFSEVFIFNIVSAK